MAGIGRPGRPSKGPRKRVEVKVPVDLAKMLEEKARQDGRDVMDWVV